MLCLLLRFKTVVPDLVAGPVRDVEHGVEAFGLGVHHDAVSQAEAALLVDLVELLLAAEDGRGGLGEGDLGSVFVAGVSAEDHFGMEGRVAGVYLLGVFWFYQTILNQFVVLKLCKIFNAVTNHTMASIPTDRFSSGAGAWEPVLRHG